MSYNEIIALCVSWQKLVIPYSSVYVSKLFILCNMDERVKAFIHKSFTNVICQAHVI